MLGLDQLVKKVKKIVYRLYCEEKLGYLSADYLTSRQTMFSASAAASRILKPGFRPKSSKCQAGALPMAPTNNMVVEFIYKLVLLK